MSRLMITHNLYSSTYQGMLFGFLFGVQASVSFRAVVIVFFHDDDAFQVYLPIGVFS